MFAGSILFSLGSLSPSLFFFFFVFCLKPIPITPALGGVCSLANYSVHMKWLNQTESPILCVLCFQRLSFCRVGRKKSPRALSKCRLYFISFGIIEPVVFFFFFFFNRIPIKPELGGVRSLENYSVHMKRLNQTESPILWVLCFQRLPFNFYSKSGNLLWNIQANVFIWNVYQILDATVG